MCVKGRGDREERKKKRAEGEGEREREVAGLQMPFDELEQKHL